MMNRFYEAWQFLAGHPVFVREDDLFKEPSNWCFMRNLDIEVVKVNPSTNMIDDNESENIKPVVWLECGTHDDHDIDLDCGGDSFEEAIIELAELVEKKFGDYRNS